MSPTDQASLAAIRQMLEERLALLRESSSNSAESRKPVELDQSSLGRLSRMDSLQMQQMALAAERRREIDLLRVEAAIRRIDKGDYGFCVVCEEPIAPRRLEADPAIPTCIKCADKSA